MISTSEVWLSQLELELKDNILSFWMKNTLIPLDMLFMDPNGKIIAIARETVPGSLRTISPGVPVKSVLELNGGRAAELGIEPGDEVVHPIFGNTDE